MKVLIAGGTGIISSGIVEMCVTKKYEVYALTRGTRVERNVPGATYLYCNLYDINSVKKVLVNLEFDVFVDCQTYSMEQLAIMLEYLSKKCKNLLYLIFLAKR